MNAVTEGHLRMNLLVQRGQSRELYKVSTVYADRFTAQLVLPVPPRTTVVTFPFTDLPKFQHASAQRLHEYEDAYGLGTPVVDRR